MSSNCLGLVSFRDCASETGTAYVSIKILRSRASGHGIWDEQKREKED